MYTVKVPYKNYKKQPQNKEVTFNLEVHEIAGLFVEFKAVSDWLESNKSGEVRILDPQEVVTFYGAIKTIMLEAWGQLSEDGEHFRKSGRYDFEESKLFAACMDLFITDPSEAVKLFDGLLPENMVAMVEKTSSNLDAIENPSNEVEQLKREVARLRSGETA